MCHRKNLKLNYYKETSQENFNMNKKTLLLIIILACILISFTLCSISPTAKCENDSTQLNVFITISISDVNLQNHTIVADVDSLRIDGIKPLTVGGTPQEPNNITVMLDDINHDLINLNSYHNYGNDTYGAVGEIKNTIWYLYSRGEAYPYDINLANFRLYSNNLIYSINGTDYGSSTEFNYTYKIENSQVSFSGLNNIDLEGTWEKIIQYNGQQLDVYLVRNASLPSFIIMLPIFWLLVLIIVIPNLCEEREIKIPIYSTILVFLPIFLFAIQGFIPPRSSPSIPEFLIILMMFMTISMIFVSLRELKKRDLFFLEMAVYLIALIFFTMLVFSSFSFVFSISLSIQLIFFTTEALLLAGMIPRVLQLIDNYFKSRKKKEALTYSGFDGDY